MVGFKEPDIKTNFMLLGKIFPGARFARQVKWRVKKCHCDPNLNARQTFNLSEIVNGTLDTLGSHPANFAIVCWSTFDGQKKATQKLGQTKIGQIWLLDFHQVIRYLNPSGSCLPSLLVIQSIRRVSRQGRLGKLESRVNLGPKKKLQQSRLLCLPRPTLLLPGGN